MLFAHALNMGCKVGRYFEPLQKMLILFFVFQVPLHYSVQLNSSSIALLYKKKYFGNNVLLKLASLIRDVSESLKFIILFLQLYN